MREVWGPSIALLTSATIAAFGPCSAYGQSNMADNSLPQETVKSVDRPGLADIVVTAQRRGENLQNVPIAVTAVDAKTLANLGGRSSEDLALIAPSVVYNSGVGGGGVNIRGIGGTNSGGDEPGNAIYMDGIYQASPSSLLFQFAGVERIEVLKGPQGTLFGRNASGGVVQIITKDPARIPTMDASIGYANYDTYEGSLYANMPLTSTIAANISLYGSKQNDGWGENVFTGNDAHDGYGYGGRGKLKWESPNSDTDIVLAGLYTKSRPAAPSAATILPGLLTGQGLGNPGFYNTRSDIDARRISDQTTISGTLHHNFGFARLLSITGYDQNSFDVTVDADGRTAPLVVANLIASIKTFTQEIQLQSDSTSPVQWTTGVFYMDSRRKDNLILTGLSQTAVGGYSSTPSEQSTKSYSAFGQLTVPITDSTKITGGLRYTIDDRHLDGFTTTANAPTPLRVSTKDKTDKKITWRLALDQKLSDRVLAYASFSRGFKSGLFNGTTPTAPAVEPQTLDAYEVGVKAETSDRRLRVNGSIFYYDFTDVQFRVLNPTGTATLFLNAGDARTYGADLDIAASPIDGLTLTGGLSLLDGKYRKNVVNVPCFSVPAPPAGGLTQFSCSPAGNNLTNSPKLAFTLGVNYEFETSLGKFNAAAAINHNSGYYIEPSNFEPARIDSYEQLTASLGWTSASGTWNARIWGRNLLNQKIIGGGDQNANAGGTYFPQSPRTYGVSAGFHF